MLTLMLWAVPAKADLLSVHADIPLSFSPTQEGSDSPDSISGARVGSACSYYRLELHMSPMKYPTQVTLLILKTPTKSLVCL